MCSQPLRQLYHCTFRLQYHLVMVTKYRRKCITKPMLSRLEEIACATTEKWGGAVLEFNGEADHVHLLLELTPRTAPSAFVNNPRPSPPGSSVRNSGTTYSATTGASRYSGPAAT